MRWLIVVAVLGALVVAGGLIPIGASSGHWWITEKVLIFAKNRSISTQSLFIETPPLDDPRRVLRGATHYEVGCRSCHGSPDFRAPRIPYRMLPPPVYLPEAVRSWSPAELFYPVKHGIKFTGMPSWPAQTRDDEVWDMVAFLRRFPELDAAGYRKLASVEDTARAEGAGLTILKSCARCHGADGESGGTGAFPLLERQSAPYLRASLEAYANGQRHSGMMGPIAAELTPAAIQQVAAHYAALPRRAPRPARDAAAVERGRALAQAGVPDRDVPACVQCHGPAKNPIHPRLEGQDADYLRLQLELFARDGRGGTPHAHLMKPVVKGLTPAQMRDVTLFYSSQAFAEF